MAEKRRPKIKLKAHTPHEYAQLKARAEMLAQSRDSWAKRAHAAERRVEMLLDEMIDRRAREEVPF